MRKLLDRKQPNREANRLFPRILLVLILIMIIFIRIPAVDDPLFGMNHVRMNDTAAIARNFYENSLNIFFPQVDWGGNSPGYVEEAFQLYTFIVALLYKIFGVSDAIGRGLSLFFYVISAIILYMLASRIFNQQVALFSVFFFGLTPLGVYYGRSFQPDILTLLCSLTAVYLFAVWSDEGTEAAFWGSGFALSIAIMMQPINLYLGIPILYLCFKRLGWGLFQYWKLYVFAALTVIPAILWFLHAHQIWIEYGNTNGMWTLPWKFRTKELLITPSFYWEMMKRLIYKITTIVGFPLFLLGIFLKQPKRNYLAHIWIASFGFIMILSAGSQLPHDYYQLPMIVAVTLLMGSASNYLWNQLQVGTLLPSPFTSNNKIFILSTCLLIMLTTNQTMGNFYGMPANMNDELTFTQQLKALSAPNSLVILGSSVSHGLEPASEKCCRHREPDGRYFGHEPVEFYQSHRKGWSVDVEDWTIEVVESLQAKGAKYFATSYAEGIKQKTDFLGDMDKKYMLLERTDKWVIFRLDKFDQSN